MANEETNAPDIIAVGGEMGDIFEMEKFDIRFDGENVASVERIEIIKWDANMGVVVDEEKATIKGMYEDTFTFDNNLFYVQDGVHKQAKKFYDINAEKSDVYLWIPPKSPEYIIYTVEMDYTIEDEEGGGTKKDTMTKDMIHIVKSSYTHFARQLRKIIDIRREAYYGRN